MSDIIKALPEGALQIKKNLDNFQKLLDTNPPKSWVKQNKFANNTSYIPIQVHEELLRRIFQQFRIEVISYTQLFHSIGVHVRVHYLHPVTEEWLFVDGLGAQNVQTEKGKNASDLGAIKDNAVMLALPAAESYAIKDACEKLGNLFGANLNRKDVVSFKSPYNKDEGLR